MASAALARLRSVAAEDLPVEVIAEAAGAALARRERGIAEAALSWVRVAAKSHPEATAELALAAAEAFAHPHREIQERAVIVIKALHRPAGLPPEVTAELIVRSTHLDPVVRLEAAALLGAPDEDGIIPARPPGVPGLPPMPPRVASLPELTELIVAFAQNPRGVPFAVERLLDGFAALGPQDSRALQAALRRLDRQLDGLSWHPAVSLLVRGVQDTRSTLERLFASGRQALDDVTLDGPPAAAMLRAQEVRRELAAGRPLRLLAYPDETTGKVDPERLVSELFRLSVAGIEAWPRDLEQAWLRTLPPPWPAQTWNQLVAIPSAGARWLAGRLAAGPLPWPTSELVEFVRPEGRAVGFATLNSWSGVAGWGGELLDRIARLPGLDDLQHRPVWDDEAALALPWHREIVAAYGVRALNRPGSGTFADRIIAQLPHLGGSTGPARWLLLGYAAGAGSAITRTAATDALAGFAPLGGVDPVSLGLTWASLWRDQQVKPGRWTAVLRDVARSSRDAAGFTWHVLHPCWRTDCRPDWTSGPASRTC